MSEETAPVPLWQLFPVGSRVRATNDNPHEGELGTVVRHEIIRIFPECGPLPVVKYDDGLQGFIVGHGKAERVG